MHESTGGMTLYSGTSQSFFIKFRSSKPYYATKK